MAYPGIALVAMIGVGLGLALWYLLTDTPNEPPHGPGAAPRREIHASTNSWDIPNNDTRRRRVRSNSKANEDCSICSEPMDQAVESMNCGHFFHTSCIVKWRETQTGNLQSMATCPLCRQSI